MKRREFLATGASAAVAAALPRAASARDAAPMPVPVWEKHRVGDFILQRAGGILRVAHQRMPERILFETAPDGNFIIAENAQADVHAFGTPQGSFTIKDRILAAYLRPSIDSIEPDGAGLSVSGKLSGGYGYRLRFEAVASAHLRFEIKTAAPANRIRLRIESLASEAFFGFGEQLTYFNQKGNMLPMLVQEHGVGRGRPILTRLVDLLAAGGGRDPYVTEAPAPHFISSRLRSLFLENLEYSVFDLRALRSAEIKVWSATMTGRILFGETPLDLIEAYTEYAGRMRVLPDWIHGGAIVASQGGMAAARRLFDECIKADVPLAGMWMQDWVGIRTTYVGQQLWWNWRLDESYYPQWAELRAALEKRGGRMLVYINPFLCNTEEHDQLFKDAAQRGYLVKTASGAPYLIKNTTFSAGLIDLSNPDTRTWIKGVIKDELIGKAGASGWMADFGEALPFDGKLYGGADTALWHNRFPEEWAKVNREAIEEAGRGEDIVFFNRSGFTQSPKFSTLFWLGDQLESWDQYDGLKSAIVGTLSGGISGFSLLHGDIGGYTTLSLTVAGRKIPIIFRSDELLQRWMEFAAFTAVFRTHEGLDTTIGAQVDSSPANMAHLARFAKVYKGLGAYRKALVAEAAQHGHPLARHLFLHYPDDPLTHELRFQFLLGRDLLVAPVVDKGADSVQVYFPKRDGWTNLWSGEEIAVSGAWKTVPAPLGKPAVFLRKDAASAGQILSGLKSVGVLP